VKRYLTAFALSSCLTAGLAQATTFVDQQPDITTNFAPILLSDFSVPIQVGDKFLLSETLNPNAIKASWYGGYVTDNVNFAAPPLVVDDFTVNIFSIVAGVTETSPIATFSGADLSVTRTATGTSLPPDPSPPDLKYELFEYSATLDFTAISVTLPPLEEYLFSVVNDSTGTANTNWYWAISEDGIGGVQAQFRSGPQNSAIPWQNFDNGQGNGVAMAFTLRSAPTPTTASMLVLALGVLGAIKTSAKKKTS